jgi:hypothetical protein
VTLAPKGLLIEESRTNLLLRSEEFNTSWSISSAALVVNTAVAPDGTLSSEKLITNAAAINGQVFQSVSKAASAVTYTSTVFAKAGEWNTVGIYVSDSASFSNRADINVNLVTGLVTSAGAARGTFTAGSGTVTSVGNDWFRISLTFTSSTETQLLNRIYSLDSVATTGDGASGIFLWGAQLEVGSFSTSYIPSVASQVTRAANSASMIGNNFARWYNVNAGTFYAQSDSFGTGTRRITFASDGTDSNRIVQSFTASTNLGFVITSGNLQAQMSVSGTGAANTALAYATDNFAFARNATLDTDSAGTVPVGLTQMQIGAGLTAATSPLNGTISRIAYFNRRLADSELQGITS